MPKAFERALLVSALLHAGLFVLIVASPSLSTPPKKGLVQYVNFIGSFGGGGGTGGGPGGGQAAARPAPPPAPKAKETLRDLTTPQKAKAEDKAGLRHPVDKPKTAKKAPEKKAAISKPQPSMATAEGGAVAAEAGQTGGQGAGYGLRFGTGGGGGTGGGIGGGGGGGEPFGISGFPFTYYLQFLSDKISASWFTSLVDPGVAGQLQTQVYFKIYRNGQASDLKIEVSSGVPAFDLSAMRAIQTAAPFAPLPAEYEGQYLGIHLVFEHSQ